ncbi:hypothetical protein [Myroides odoratimimus]|uniref:hypothetical protein n=1 Tax=Myroides odoratimimus TaxID=76832 RepID=UPI0013B428DE|nr:hypothetical protein [Myroides odoratimimus]
MKNNVINLKTGKEYYMSNPEAFVSNNRSCFALIEQKQTQLPEEVIEKEKEVKKKQK